MAKKKAATKKAKTAAEDIADRIAGAKGFVLSVESEGQISHIKGGNIDFLGLLDKVRNSIALNKAKK